MLKDPIQNTESGNCGPFQLYLYKNVFGASGESKILGNEGRGTSLDISRYHYFH